MGAGGAPTVVRRWSGGGPVVGAGGGPVGAGGGPVVSKSGIDDLVEASVTMAIESRVWRICPSKFDF
ncbi:hypothetical protein LXL04_003022 [Taraxacum kok-saghyz]